MCFLRNHERDHEAKAWDQHQTRRPPRPKWQETHLFQTRFQFNSVQFVVLEYFFRKSVLDSSSFVPHSYDVLTLVFAAFAGQQHPCHEWEEQQRYWPSPRAPPASPTESPRTPGGSQKKAVLGKVKSKAKKWMHMLHHKKKPAPPEEMMWTPRAGPGPSAAQDSMPREERHAAEHRGTGTPRKPQQHAPSCSCTSASHGPRASRTHGVHH